MRIRTAKELGAEARRARVELEKSQEEVARSAGVTRQWLSRFEQGVTDVSLSKALAVLDVLGVAIRTGGLRSDPAGAPGPLFDAETIRRMQDSIARSTSFVNSPEFKESMQRSLSHLARLNLQNNEQLRRQISALADSALVMPKLAIEQVPEDPHARAT
jgi:transcriptional regulator with XRE-family HTH domain